MLIPKFFDLSKFCPEPDIDFFMGHINNILIYFLQNNQLFIFWHCAVFRT